MLSLFILKLSLNIMWWTRPSQLLPVKKLPLVSLSCLLSLFLLQIQLCVENGFSVYLALWLNSKHKFSVRFFSEASFVFKRTGFAFRS